MRRYLKYPLIPCLTALIWAGLVCFLMLAPGENSPVESTSHAFGGTDLTDAVGHAVLFGIFAIVWQRALVQRFDQPYASRITIAIALILGTITELIQFWVPHRGTSLMDLSANWLGVLIFAGWTWHRSCFRVR